MESHSIPFRRIPRLLGPVSPLPPLGLKAPAPRNGQNFNDVAAGYIHTDPHSDGNGVSPH